MPLDPYKVLGVSRTASADEIKKVYRTKVKSLHPDLHPNDKKKHAEFKQVSAAFEIIGDKDKRLKFDRGEIDSDGNPRGFAGARPGGGGSYRGGSPFGGGSSDPFDEIFSGMFGGGRRRGPGPKKGRDIRYRVEISFEDAVLGALRRMDMADGRVLEVNIPGGIETGQTLRLRSQGQDSFNGGAPGDALLDVTVKASPKWVRDGDDLRMNVPVSLKTAVLGGTVDVETPSGSVALKVPSGSNTGAILRLRSKGVQTKPAGHLYARLEIVLDDPKSAELKRFLTRKK